MKPETTEVLNFTRARLDSVAPELTAALTAVAGGSYGLSKNNHASQVHVVDIELFEDGYRLVAYPLSADEKQLGSMPLLPKYPDGVLSGYDYDLDYDLYDSDDEDEIEEFYRLQKDIFIQWFIACWQNTGTPALQKPVYFSAHNNDEQSYDLQNNRWVSDDDKWG